MEPIFETFRDNPDEFMPYFVIGISALIAITALIGWFVSSVVNSRNDSRTRRELAAYVAEGSMTPDDAERLLSAAPAKSD